MHGNVTISRDEHFNLSDRNKHCSVDDDDDDDDDDDVVVDVVIVVVVVGVVILVIVNVVKTLTLCKYI